MGSTPIHTKAALSQSHERPDKGIKIMAFSCECDVYPKFCHVSHRRARKNHTCYECGHVIAPGEDYMHMFSIDDYCYTTKLCERCDDLMEAFKGLGYCTLYGSLFEDYRDWLEETHPLFDEDGEPINGYTRASDIQQKHKNWKPGNA